MSRLVAATTMAVAVTVLVYGLEHPLGALLQHGAIRFGLPIGVVVGAVAEARWPRAATPARLLQLVTVAVAAVWALEAFAYTLLTVLVVAGFQVALLPDGSAPGAGALGGPARRRHRGRPPAPGRRHARRHRGAARTGAGTSTPCGQFLFGDLGDWTYDFSSFSPGLAVGAALPGQRVRARA